MYSETKKVTRMVPVSFTKVPSHIRAILLFFIILSVGLAAWQLAVDKGLLMKLVPSPSRVIVEAIKVLQDPFYYDGTNDFGIGIHLLASLERVAIGFILATIVAVPLGFLIGMSEVFSKAVDPFFQLLRPVSPLAWLPIGLAVLKSSEGTAIFVIFISSIWPILINTIFGVRSTSGTYLKIAKTLEASKWMTVRYVLLPAAMPSIVTGLRISLGIAWLVIIAAEMLVGGKGIGYYIWNEWNNLNLSSIIVCIILVGLVGLVLDKLLYALEKRIKYEP